MSDDPPYMEWQPGMGGFAASPPSEHDQLREAAITIRDLTARAVTAEADLAVLVQSLRDMDPTIHADGCHIVNHAEFEADPDHLRRLLTEDQT